ncbi:DUF882 domain-containing protein [Thermodesulfobacteriota bacterium]
MFAFRMPKGASKMRLNRRGFLRLLLWAGLISYPSKSALAFIDYLAPEEKLLSLYNPNTKEKFDSVYWRNGSYVAEALKDINYLLRDVRTDAIKPIDKDLLDLIFSISIKLKPQKPLHIMCGYRTSRTNSLLLKRNKSAAKNSYHIKGQAVDIRLPGLRTSELRRAAYELRQGGIGYYPRRRFVHIDVGPVRYWNG